MTALAEVFSWVELYESDETDDALRREVDDRLGTIAEGVRRIAAVRSSGEAWCPEQRPEDRDERADLAHVLANLNSAELHVGDYLGS